MFTTVALTLVEAVNEIGKLSIEVHREAQILLRLESILEENSKVPQIEAGELRTDPDEFGASYEVIVERVEMRSGEGFLLPNIFSVRVNASWPDGSGDRVVSAETYRYAPMYRN